MLCRMTFDRVFLFQLSFAHGLRRLGCCVSADRPINSNIFSQSVYSRAEWWVVRALCRVFFLNENQYFTLLLLKPPGGRRYE